MLKAAGRSVAVWAVLLGTWTVTYGQPPQVRTEQRVVPQKAYRVKSILGATVQVQGSANVGTVADIVIDDEGVIDYLVVSQGDKLVTVPWEAVKFNFEKRLAVVNLTQNQYRQVPTYTTETYPEFYAPTYQAEIYRHYNLTPGQSRRLERRINRK
jgi:sporulation protein YlmC with PRC-barrel domain